MSIINHLFIIVLLASLAGCTPQGASVTPNPTTAPTATTVPTATTAPTATPPPTATATPVPTATPPPTATAVPQVTSYLAHTVADGETLASLASSFGSEAGVIASYNKLTGEPQPGRALIIPRLGNAAPPASEAVLVQRGRGDQPLLALTLDAGASSAPTPRMLDALKERNIRITFFLTGKWIRENPELVRRIVADGHEVANHSLSHPDFREISDAQIVEELSETERLLQETVGDGVTSRPFFRPPFGGYDQRVLNGVIGQGYLPIYWTLDSLDSVGQPKTPAFLLSRVTETLSPEQLRGAIILAHCGSEATAEALPAILDRFASMGFTVTTVSAVLGQ